MQQRIYTVYDAVMNIYHTPFMAHNDGDATRIIQGSADPNSQLWIHSGDYSLYFIGHFDNELAVFQNLNAPQLVNKVSIILHILKENYEQSKARTQGEQSNV